MWYLGIDRCSRLRRYLLCSQKQQLIRVGGDGFAHVFYGRRLLAVALGLCHSHFRYGCCVLRCEQTSMRLLAKVFCLGHCRLGHSLCLQRISQVRIVFRLFGVLRAMSLARRLEPHFVLQHCQAGGFGRVGSCRKFQPFLTRTTEASGEN